MEYRQRKLGQKQSFVLGEDSFVYSTEDSLQKHRLTIGYMDLPNLKAPLNQIEETHRIGHYVASCFGLVGIVQFLITATIVDSHEGRLLSIVWVCIALSILVAARLMRVTYTIIDTAGGRVSVIHDSKHDGILDALHERRKNIYLAKFGAIGGNNTEAEELEKFRWFRDEAIISEDEYNQKVLEVREYFAEPESPGDAQVH